MTSLLERMGLELDGGGAVRSSLTKRRASPYARPPKGDINAPWSHDLFEPARSLSQRISSSSDGNNRPPSLKPTINALASKALRAATSMSGGGTNGSGSGTAGTAAPLSIKGASTLAHGNVVQVTGLVPGTTSEDVVAIFKRCGPILSARIVANSAAAVPSDSPVIRITYKTPQAARDAVAKFDKQPADGRVLSVVVVGGASTALAGRLGDGNHTADLAVVRDEGSVDVLMQDETEPSTGGSKLRSDSLLKSDVRAHVLLAPPGTDPAEYMQTPARTGGRRRVRGGRP